MAPTVDTTVSCRSRVKHGRACIRSARADLAARPVRPAPRRAAGFTLVEILLTVAILGLAGLLVIPYMTNLPSFETEAAVRQIVSDLSYAQSDAMARQQPRRVLFDVESDEYRLLGDDFTVNEDELYDPISHTGDNRYIRNFATDDRFSFVTIESADFDNQALFITYDELGGPVRSDGGPSTGGRVVVDGKNESFEILVSPFTGRVSVNKL